jgi:hypothetical protein
MQRNDYNAAEPPTASEAAAMGAQEREPIPSGFVWASPRSPERAATQNGQPGSLFIIPPVRPQSTFSGEKAQFAEPANE